MLINDIHMHLSTQTLNNTETELVFLLENVSRKDDAIRRFREYKFLSKTCVKLVNDKRAANLLSQFMCRSIAVCRSHLNRSIISSTAGKRRRLFAPYL